MKPEKISVMDEDFVIYSLPSDEGCGGVRDGAVILLPSLSADFSVRTVNSSGTQPTDYYAAAVSAAALLVMKRGLPLSEITFETPRGILEICCTGRGVFSLTVPKCKLLSKGRREIMGCDVTFADVLVGEKYRIIHTDNRSGFDFSKLPLFLSDCTETPAAVIHSAALSGQLSADAYSAHSIIKPTRLSAFAAASYGAYHTSGVRRFLSGGSTAEVALGSVTLTVLASIQG